MTQNWPKRVTHSGGVSDQGEKELRQCMVRMREGVRVSVENDAR